ncbi:hypothetical protein SCHPADRAFT_864090 [Schizopora paradoxa]|uniref:Pyridoxamine 5'-phosphate oxidase Alr4036 family FMN-binding domain-containing protein n=1 Tax=Schizopora paradoxa TaxID=27342 RepID=A0A0H2SSU5_9AGAM|nr:hypothetical protein SCHPADRAFT_864090 [Schizopora paradoxa]
MRGQIPRWKPALDRALEKDPKSNEAVYQLATLDEGSALQARVRTVVHRGFFDKESRSPLLYTTTDIRLPKASQIAANSRVELAFWIPGVQEQFRISGNAYILPSSRFLEDTHELQGGLAPLPEKETQRIVKAAKELSDSFFIAKLLPDGFDWEGKRVEVFDSMSAHMKASWVRPVPGTPLKKYEDAKAWPEVVPKVGEAKGEEKAIVKEALKNFALVVIDPFFVDYVELGVTPNQRTTFTKDANGWTEEIVVP